MPKPAFKEKVIIAIVGPTASGKTALGVELAKAIGGEVINCDSVQVYKDTWIATAKPCEEEMQGIPHHLIGYVDPNINYTAADWARDAAKKIAEIEERGAVPILVGGTGFYLRTLRKPLFDSPATDITLRQRLKARLEARGSEHLYKILTRIDPAAASLLFPNDHVRVMRAIEVFIQTGEKISEKQPLRAQPPEFADRIKIFALGPDRAELYEKINARTESHFAVGLVEEVIKLRSQGVNDDTNALGAHSYRRVCEYLRGERDLNGAIERSKQDVRNYAKRQMTWFRSEPGVIWLNNFGQKVSISEIIEKLGTERK